MTKGNKTRHIHFIGIAGSAIAQLAVLMKKSGYKITGSEHNKVWEPMKSFLANNKIEYTELEYELENVRKADLVILGGSALLKDDKHPEYLEAKRLGKEIRGYAYLVGKYIAKEKSIVVSGSYAKSTISSLLTWIAKQANLNPAYMIGGKIKGLESGVDIGSGDISICEGDEFVSVWGFDMEPRFLYYKPTHVVMTSAEWDHIDVYKSLEEYTGAFQKLSNLIEEKNGFILFNAAGENLDVVFESYNGDFATYHLASKDKVLDCEPDYIADEFKFDSEAMVSEFSVYKAGQQLGIFSSRLIGRANVENCLAAIAMADVLGIAVSEIIKGVRSFPGVKRRFEILGKAASGALIIDDYAHSPIKAKASLTALRDFYPDRKIVAVYFPRASLNSDRKTLNWYPGAFDKADKVIIPRVDVSKDTPKSERVYGIDIVESIARTQKNVEYIPVDKNIVKFIHDETDENSIVVFQSATGWEEIKAEVLSEAI